MYKYFTINASKFTKKIYTVIRNTLKKNRIFVHKTVSKGNKPRKHIQSFHKKSSLKRLYMFSISIHLISLPFRGFNCVAISLF